MLRRGKTLGELAAEFPTFYQAKGQFRCSPEERDAVYARIISLFETDADLTANAVRETRIDGLKRIYGDNSWLLLRPSGTEPLFRIYSDAMTQERADELIRQGTRVVEGSIARVRENQA